MRCSPSVLPLPLREGVGGRGRCQVGCGPLPLPPSRKGRGRALLVRLLPPLLLPRLTRAAPHELGSTPTAAGGACRNPGDFGTGPAVCLTGHAGLCAGHVAADAALRSVRAHAPSARGATLFGAGCRRARKRQSPDGTSGFDNWIGRNGERCGAQGALSGSASLRGHVCRIRRFLALADQAARRALCRRLRPCHAPTRRRI